MPLLPHEIRWSNAKFKEEEVMNESILRGYCAKCEDKLIFNLQTKEGIDYQHRDISLELHIIEPIWFLSAKQMEIVQNSEKFFEWCGTTPHPLDCSIATLIVLLETEPFLVAKILKEEGERNEV